MNEVRELRRRTGLSQRAFAQLIGVPVNTFRMWDSGLRCVPITMLRRAREAATQWDHQSELLPLDRLASELGVHVRTLQAAARTGRLTVQFSTRSVFGRPMQRATRAAGDLFKRTHFRQYSRRDRGASPLPSVPADYDWRLKRLRQRARLTQAALARRIGAAGKAVVYQWESRKRTPSPVFWQKVEDLERCART
jgi:DNA-binding transcriptional regulator YiaG